jgi:asparagine N-glycosylation enzyme membrane subunit Stt3
MNGAYQFFKKNGVTISFALGALLAIISIVVIVAGFPTDATKEELYESPVFNTALNLTIILIGICTLVAILGAVYGMALNPKGAIRFGIITAVLLVVFFICKAMGVLPTGDELITFQGNHNKHLVAENVAFVDGLLRFTIVMMFLAALAWVFSAVWGFIKQR